MSRKQAVFIIESHPVLRESYAFLIGRQKGMDICGVAARVPDALEAVATVRPDVIVVNLPVDRTHGLEHLKALHAAVPDVPLIVVAPHDASLYGPRVRAHGAAVYVTRERVPTELVACVRHLGLFGAPPPGKAEADAPDDVRRPAYPGMLTPSSESRPAKRAR